MGRRLRATRRLVIHPLRASLRRVVDLPARLGGRVARIDRRSLGVVTSVFHILTGALTQSSATSQPEAKPRSKQNPRHLNRFHRPYLRLVPCRLYMSRFPIFPARCTSVTNPSAASNGNCASKWVYFSTSAIWILRSNSPAGPLAIPPAEWKHEPDASCPDPRRTDARRHPVDPDRKSTRLNSSH